MFRIRFHGRGGQGIKTASRILGSAFFLEGFQTQDAPRYGAERRGAPIFAYVRASKTEIHERGIISNPDLIIVADDSLVSVPAAGVIAGASDKTTLLISTTEKAGDWQHRLNFPGEILVLPAPEEIDDRLELRYVGAACAGAAGRLTGVISAASLEKAIRIELQGLRKTIVNRNLERGLRAYEQMTVHAGCVNEGKVISAKSFSPPDWIDMPFETARVAAPAIYGEKTSEAVQTGLWRTMRPVINYELCNRCWWICSSSCPDGAINLNSKGQPDIDYDHCKGCLICTAVCPPHAIAAVSEHLAAHNVEAGS